MGREEKRDYNSEEDVHFVHVLPNKKRKEEEEED